MIIDRPQQLREMGIIRDEGMHPELAQKLAQLVFGYMEIFVTGHEALQTWVPIQTVRPYRWESGSEPPVPGRVSSGAGAFAALNLGFPGVTPPLVGVVADPRHGTATGMVEVARHFALQRNITPYEPAYVAMFSQAQARSIFNLAVESPPVLEELTERLEALVGPDPVMNGAPSHRLRALAEIELGAPLSTAVDDIITEALSRYVLHGSQRVGPLAHAVGSTFVRYFGMRYFGAKRAAEIRAEDFATQNLELNGLGPDGVVPQMRRTRPILTVDEVPAWGRLLDDFRRGRHEDPETLPLELSDRVRHVSVPGMGIDWELPSSKETSGNNPPSHADAYFPPHARNGMHIGDALFDALPAESVEQFRQSDVEPLPELPPVPARELMEASASAARAHVAMSGFVSAPAVQQGLGVE